MTAPPPNPWRDGCLAQIFHLNLNLNIHTTRRAACSNRITYLLPSSKLYETSNEPEETHSCNALDNVSGHNYIWWGQCIRYCRHVYSIHVHLTKIFHFTSQTNYSSRLNMFGTEWRTCSLRNIMWSFCSSRKIWYPLGFGFTFWMKGYVTGSCSICFVKLVRKGQY